MNEALRAKASSRVLFFAAKAGGTALQVLHAVGGAFVDAAPRKPRKSSEHVTPKTLGVLGSASAR